MRGADRLIEFTDQGPPVFGEGHSHDSAIVTRPMPLDQFRLDQAVDQTGDVRIAGHHPLDDLLAARPFAAEAAKDSQDVVLRSR